MVSSWLCHFNPGRWNVVEVLFAMGRELDAFEWKGFVVFARGDEGEMRFVQATGQEEGLPVLVGFLQPLDGVVDRVHGSQ